MADFSLGNVNNMSIAVGGFLTSAAKNLPVDLKSGGDSGARDLTIISAAGVDA
jgi:acyl CoA:acetate/3-ketoacid CoA transferase alpha subunit